MSTGYLTTWAWGWSVFRTICPSIAPGSVPGGTVTVSRYLPAESASRVIATLIFSGLSATVNWVSRSP